MMPRMNAVIANQVVTPTAANQVLFHFGYGGYPAGGFFRALLEAWDHADMINSAKLAQVFPEYGAALAILGDDHLGAESLREIGMEAVRRTP